MQKSRWLILTAGLAVVAFVLAMVVRDYQETAPPIVPQAANYAQ